MLYDNLLRDASRCGVSTYEVRMVPRIKGLYSDDTIWINKAISTSAEKTCILAEELGHYHTSAGDILDQTKTNNRRQELRARQWAYNRLIPLECIVEAYQAHAKGRHEVAEYLGVTESFLQAAIDRYRDKYGLCVVVNDRYTVYFDPLGVAEMLPDETPKSRG